jgi:group I intron endonuclease
MIGIYKIINPKGKIYIGQSIDVDIRWKYSYFNLNCSQQPKLYNSLKKYGVNNHKFEVIEECNLDELNDKEVYWKKYYLKEKRNNLNEVLFLKIYDAGGGPLLQPHKDKIGMSLRGKKHSEETKKKMSEKAKGRKYSEESKKKMSEVKKGKTFTKEQKKNFKGKKCRPILQYDLEGNFIKEWVNFKSIKDKHGFHNSGLCYCCQGVQKTAYGFIWRYKE